MDNLTNPSRIIDLSELSASESDEVVIRLSEYNFLTTFSQFHEACVKSSQYEFPNQLRQQLSNLSFNRSTFSDLHGTGQPAKILFPGQQWISGKIRARLVLEFIPDQPSEPPQQDVSILDDPSILEDLHEDLKSNS